VIGVRREELVDEVPSDHHTSRRSLPARRAAGAIWRSTPGGQGAVKGVIGD
jgi:hypothetical protein